MSAEYPEPGSANPSFTQGGPYFVPGISSYTDGVDRFAHDFANGDYDENDGFAYERDAQPLDDTSSDDSTEERVAAFKVEQQKLRDAENDTDFDPAHVNIHEEDDDPLSDSGVEDEGTVRSGRSNARGRGRGRGRGDRGRGRGVGRPRGRGGSIRGARAASLDDGEIDGDLFGNKTRAPRRAPRGEGRGIGRKGKRGPRMAPTSDAFKALQSQATNAFLDKRYEDCAQNCIDAIQLNPEVFVAHSLLSQAYAELGRRNDSIEVLFNGALTRRGTDSWHEVAERVKSLMPDEEERERDTRLLQIYSNIVRIDRDDYEARKERLDIFHRHDNHHAIIKECRRVLISYPNDLYMLRLLVDASLKHRTPSSARAAWETAVPHFVRTQDMEDANGFTFEDLNLYLDLLKALRDWQNGLEEAKRLARWLLGRRDDIIWEMQQDDDREWDDEDEPRRMEVPDFIPDKYQPEQYGQGLPADLRVKMGMFRLHVSPNNVNEALHHFEPFDEDNLPEDAKIDFADLIRDISEVLHIHGHHADSLRFFRSLEDWLGHEPLTWRRAGLSAYAIGDELKAIEYLEKYLTASSRDTEARIKLAAMHERHGNKERVQEHIEGLVLRETIYTIRTKEVDDEDALALVRHLEANLGALSRRPDDEDDLDVANAPAIDTIGISPRTSSTELTPRQLLNRMFARIFWKSRPNYSFAQAPHLKRASVFRNGRLAPFAEILAGEDRIEGPSKAIRNQYHTRRRNGLQDLEDAEVRIKELYAQLQEAELDLRDDDPASRDNWTDIGTELCAEFFDQKSFFPSDKNVAFCGFSVADRARARSILPKTKEFLQTWAAHLMQRSDDAPPDAKHWMSHLEGIPMSYADIPYPRWLSIILQVSLNLARHNGCHASYTILDRLLTCNLFANHKRTEQHIYLACLACAITLNDNWRQNEIIRYFVNECAPDPDVYRLFQIVNRSYKGDIHHYSTGPQQKFFARMIRAHDHLAMSTAQRSKQQSTQSFTKYNMASLANGRMTESYYPTRDPDKGGTDVSVLDPQLLIAYGNMITANNSHQVNALNYYMRAYAVQRDNPLALLSAACAYAAMSMKRLSLNRQHQMISAMAMTMRYKEIRMQGGDGNELSKGRLWRQRKLETEYNEGRMWHFYGLMHLAVPCYERMLEVAEGEDGLSGEGVDEGVLWDEPDFTMEAALALQSIYVHSGNVEGARRLGERWLVF